MTPGAVAIGLGVFVYLRLREVRHGELAGPVAWMIVGTVLGAMAAVEYLTSRPYAAEADGNTAPATVARP